MKYGWYHKCPNPICYSKVKYEGEFCCTPCRHAHENRYEIDKHSESCIQRQAERA